MSANNEWVPVETLNLESFIDSKTNHNNNNNPSVLTNPLFTPNVRSKSNSASNSRRASINNNHHRSNSTNNTDHELSNKNNESFDSEDNTNDTVSPLARELTRRGSDMDKKQYDKRQSLILSQSMLQQAISGNSNGNNSVNPHPQLNSYFATDNPVPSGNNNTTNNNSKYHPRSQTMQVEERPVLPFNQADYLTNLTNNNNNSNSNNNSPHLTSSSKPKSNQPDITRISGSLSTPKSMNGSMSRNSTSSNSSANGIATINRTSLVTSYSSNVNLPVSGVLSQTQITRAAASANNSSFQPTTPTHHNQAANNNTNNNSTNNTNNLNVNSNNSSYVSSILSPIMSLFKNSNVVENEQTRRDREEIIQQQLKKEWLDLLTNNIEQHNSNSSINKNNKKLINLVWRGIPSSIREQAWKSIISNDLNITEDLYYIFECRAKEIRNNITESRLRGSTDINRENTMNIIDKDIPRTFPELKFFHEEGPLHSALQSILYTYVCYRPDTGYVQGMSYIAAMLLINMDTIPAFIALANLLNSDLYFKFFRMNTSEMHSYFTVYQYYFKLNLPTIYMHFEHKQIKPEMYMYEWLLPIFTRCLPLNVASRVWDNFLVLGQSFLFRTALGIIRTYSSILETAPFEQCIELLLRPKTNIDADTLFNNIAKIEINATKMDKLIKQALTNTNNNNNNNNTNNNGNNLP